MFTCQIYYAIEISLSGMEQRYRTKNCSGLFTSIIEAALQVRGEKSTFNFASAK